MAERSGSRLCCLRCTLLALVSYRNSSSAESGGSHIETFLFCYIALPLPLQAFRRLSQVILHLMKCMKDFVKEMNWMKKSAS
ncbi:hypothetical protein K450DRAFT_225725 [Umbelopsis ramanniana AG]|uniref:Secreted protein n=1 Tax=Umbelopsis ramanniana AG TaxID=1314678 RepID=A0AAD5HI75_UMBRA|nr:uncharacterized protein K450DRAFT_225725 [Umbelopsis ramanniana AG]KAI8582978.1 hypothetical protein K450DRAFT_225725 [Umbelopsis ramanniana AG]